MQETAVLRHVAEHFLKDGYRVWYNRRGLGSLPYPTHEVAVAGRYPDLLAVDRGEHIVAVEAKGIDGDLATGLGQALVYKKGAHVTFLAAPREALESMADTALVHGVGILGVSEAGVVEARPPLTSQPPRYLDDVQRELAILEARGDQTRRIGSTKLVLNHPLHYVAPVLLFDDVMPFEQVAAALNDVNDGWGLGSAVVDAPIEGARILGLVAEDQNILQLTDKGRLIRRMLTAALGNRRIPSVRRLTSQGSGLLIDKEPLLGGIVRFLYMEDPDIRMLRDHLKAASGSLTLRELLWELLVESPNVVLSAFCSKQGKERLIGHLLRGTEEEALCDKETPNWLMKRSYFQLKRQLTHIGILRDHPARGGGRREEELDNDIWELRY